MILGPVILPHALRQRRTIGGAATDHAMEIDVADSKPVARAHPPSVRAERTLEAPYVVIGAVEEVVVALRVGA